MKDEQQFVREKKRKTFQTKTVACAKTGEMSKNCLVGDYVIPWGGGMSCGVMANDRG